MPNYLKPTDELAMATELEEKTAAEVMAEATGRPVEEFEVDPDDYPIPELDELESVDPEEVYD